MVRTQRKEVDWNVVVVELGFGGRKTWENNQKNKFFEIRACLMAIMIFSVSGTQPGPKQPFRIYRINGHTFSRLEKSKKRIEAKPSEVVDFEILL